MTELITDREFAALLRLGKYGHQTVQKWVREGKLKNLTVRVGDLWRFKADAIETWIQQGGMPR